MNTPTSPRPQAVSFDPVAAGKEIDALDARLTTARKKSQELAEALEPIRKKRDAVQEEYGAALREQEAAGREAFAANKELMAKLVEAHDNVPDFKAFLKDHTHISRSYAYELLDVLKGRVTREEQRAKTAKRVRGHRQAKGVSVTSNVTDTTDANVVPFPTPQSDADDEFWQAHADYIAAYTGHSSTNDLWEERTAAFYRMLAAHAKGGGYQCPVVRPTGVTVQ